MAGLPDRVQQILSDQFWQELERLSQNIRTGVAERSLERIYSDACTVLDLIDQLREPALRIDEDENAPALDPDDPPPKPQSRRSLQ
jgi:hypothetical protein